MRGAKALLVPDVPDATRIREALDRAAQQALRAGDIIKRLREFVAKGETQHSLESPVTLLEEAVALALLGAKEQGIRVAIRSDRDMPSIVVDKIQIQQVVLNLVRNAIEAMASSPRRELTVGVTKTDGVATFTVADTGPGVSPDVADRLFQPFITTKEHGMGVGLSICRTIVEIPRRTHRGPPKCRRRHGFSVHPPVRGGRRRSMTARPTILVIDDDPAMRDSLAFLLDVNGFAVATYETAADFLGQFEAAMSTASCPISACSA